MNDAWGDDAELELPLDLRPSSSWATAAPKRVPPEPARVDENPMEALPDTPDLPAPSAPVIPEHALAEWAAEQAAAAAVEMAQDAVAEAEGRLRVAAAVVDDLETADDPSRGQRVEAHEAVEAAERAVVRAQKHVRAASDAHAAAVRALSAALAAGPTSSTEGEPGLAFANFEEWFREFVVPVYRRRVGKRGGEARWSKEWWKNPEAVFRIRALWMSFEAARLEPGGAMVAWLRDAFDRTMDTLMRPDGPFWNEPKDLLIDNADGEEWDVTVPPPGIFPDYRDTAR